MYKSYYGHVFPFLRSGGGIAGSCDKCVLNFISNCQTAFQSVCSIVCSNHNAPDVRAGTRATLGGTSRQNLRRCAGEGPPTVSLLDPREHASLTVHPRRLTCPTLMPVLPGVPHSCQSWILSVLKKVF